MRLLTRIASWLRPSTPSAPPPPPYIDASPELIAQIHVLKQQADWMGRLLEDEERNFTYGEDGTIQFGMSQGGTSVDTMFSYAWAYNQCLFRPSYGACFFINEAQHRIVRARSRAFTAINPYWHGVQHNLKTHIIGKGHSWTVVPKHAGTTVPKERLAKVQKVVDEFYLAGYRQVQCEKVERKSRDGEYFLQYLIQDRKLKLRFIEPLLIQNPPTPDADCLFGILFRKGDYETPLSYFVRQTDWLGGNAYGWSRPISADRLQHKKVNVDRSCPRGVPDTYWVQSRLEQSLRTLRAMGTLVQVRAKIAMIRKHINALAGAVQPQLSAAAAATIAGPGSQVRNVFSYSDGSILDTSDQSEYQFPGTNIETDKIVASVQADLQAVASSMGLADYMVSGSLGSGSYATAMVSEGPVVKTFEEQQQDTIDEDKEVVGKLIETEIDYGRLEDDTLDIMAVEMNGPPLAGRNEAQHAQANQIKCQNKVLSVTTWQQQEGLNPEVERANIESNPSPAVAAADAMANGQDSTQPRERQKSTARPFSPDDEPRQKQRASGATREEDAGTSSGKDMLWALFQNYSSKLQESSYEPHSKDAPTAAEMEMAAVFITPDWLAKTKSDIMSLPNGQGSPRDWSPRVEYEPGIQAVRLGEVDGQQVYAVDASAMMIAHDAMDFVVAGNHMRWPWIPADKMVVDWSYATIDAAHDILHEAIETRLMDIGKWSYALAHKIANWLERLWILELRPELAGLANKE